MTAPPIVYVGPSLDPDSIRQALPQAQAMPPIRRGDLYRDRMLGFHVFVIIDGVFFQDLPVPPREIVDVVRDAGPKVLITQAEFAEVAEAVGREVDLVASLSFGPGSDGSLDELVAREGFSTTTAHSLREARSEISKSFPDVTLVDLNLPDSHGLATFTEVASTVPETPVIVLTGSADEQLGLDGVAERAPADELLGVRGPSFERALVRSHGGLFHLLAQRLGELEASGVVQVVVRDEEVAHSLRNEYCLKVTGEVVARKPGNENPHLATGEIELQIQDYVLQSAADVVPLQVNSDEAAGEEVRLRYRFLDLRRDRVHANIVLRSKVISSIRRRMIDAGFTEFQTPILTSSSPEGARDFLVPARMHPGEFYALPQSPQLFKQLLMVAGFDRYYQIVKCFRDEDLRADRQPEFTQIDVETSFLDEEEIRTMFEGMIRSTFKNVIGVDMPAFPVMTHTEAMRLYGSDKPDLRFGNPLVECTDYFKDTTFRVFQAEYVGAVVMPGGASQPRKQLDAMHAQFMEEVITPAILPQAHKLLRQHFDAGDLVCIITATNRFVTAPIAKALGVEHLIAAVPEEDAEGNLTGKLLGIAGVGLTLVVTWVLSILFVLHFMAGPESEWAGVVLQVAKPGEIDTLLSLLRRRAAEVGSAEKARPIVALAEGASLFQRGLHREAKRSYVQAREAFGALEPSPYRDLMIAQWGRETE